MRLIGQSALFLAAAAAASCSKHRSPVQTKPDAAPMAAVSPGGTAKPAFASVSAGDDHTRDAKTDSAVVASTEIDVNVSLRGLAFTSVSAGGGHTCGVKTDKTIACWGYKKDWNGKPLGQAKPPAGTFSSVSAGGDHRHLTRSTHQFALCLAQGAPPFHVVGTGRNCLAVHADGIADAAHATEKIAVVDQGLVAAVAVEA